jgi:hypothetical protein
MGRLDPFQNGTLHKRRRILRLIQANATKHCRIGDDPSLGLGEKCGLKIHYPSEIEFSPDYCDSVMPVLIPENSAHKKA